MTRLTWSQNQHGNERPLPHLTAVDMPRNQRACNIIYLGASFVRLGSLCRYLIRKIRQALRVSRSGMEVGGGVSHRGINSDGQTQNPPYHYWGQQ